VQVAEYDRPMLSDDVETAQTVGMMDEYADQDAGARSVIDATHEALDTAGLTLASDPEAIARAIFWFLKRTIRYVDTPGTSPLVDQTLITPTAILSMPEPIGDCPQFSMLAAAMFRVCCIPCYFVTIAAERSFPDQFSHVYNTVEVAPGQFMPFDSSNGPEPGAEYAMPFKRRVWPRVTRDKCSSARKGANPMMRTTYAARPGFRNRSLRGTMGQTCILYDETGACDLYDDGSSPSSTISVPTAPTIPGGYGATVPINYGTLDSSLAATEATLNPPAGGTTPSGAAGVLTTLFNDAAGVAAPIVKAATTMAPYYITNPLTGQSVLYNPNTATVATGASLATALSPTTIVIGLGLLAGLLFLGKK
jgi:hypothetical protein